MLEREATQYVSQNCSFRQSPTDGDGPFTILLPIASSRPKISPKRPKNSEEPDIETEQARAVVSCAKTLRAMMKEFCKANGEM